MCPDKFPEAFDRYRKEIDTSKIKSLQQLLASFGIWQNEKRMSKPLTRRQTSALSKEGHEKLGLSPVMLKTFTVKRKIRTQYYNIEKKRFSKSTGEYQPRPKMKVIGKSKTEMGEYKGMNYYAHKELYPKEKYGHRKTTILVDKSISKTEKETTVRHELREYEYMRKGMKYKEAHEYANREEKIK